MVEAHTAQHVGCLAEVEEQPFEQCDACLSKSTTSGLFVIDNKTEMTTIVYSLLAPLLKGNELVTEINEAILSLLPRSLNSNSLL
jgi:hypothetical protein